MRGNDRMSMEKCEVISGFAVFPFPEKPDYLPISNEEFKQRTLEAWTHGDVNSRVSAAFRGGEQEWALLWNDESYSVRGAVACRASEEYQLKLVNEPVFAVRKMLAIYGTDRVRLALLEQGEPDKDVLRHIAKFGSAAVRHRLVKEAWNQESSLFQCVPYLPQSSLEKLLAHPSMDIRVEAALYGSRDQCRRVLDMSCSSREMGVRFCRDMLIHRIKELDEVAEAIHSGKTKTRKYETMEL